MSLGYPKDPSCADCAASWFEARLSEATALLEMFKVCCADEPRERVRAFLSRATPPAEPWPHSTQEDIGPPLVQPPTPTLVERIEEVVTQWGGGIFSERHFTAHQYMTRIADLVRAARREPGK